MEEEGKGERETDQACAFHKHTLSKKKIRLFLYPPIPNLDDYNEDPEKALKSTVSLKSASIGK